MDLVNKTALLFCLLLSVYVDAEDFCTIVAQESNNSCRSTEFMLANVSIMCKGKVNITVTTISCETIDCNSGSGSGSSSSDDCDNGFYIACRTVESTLSNQTACRTAESNTPCELNCTSPLVPWFNCTRNTIAPCELNCTSPLVPWFNCTGNTTTIPPVTTTSMPSSTTMSTTPYASTQATRVSTTPTSTHTTTVSSGPSTTIMSSNPSTTTDTITMTITMFNLSMVLWITLGCLIALIIITLCAIFLVSIAHCRRYKRKKKQPTALDIISKWEDTPNESSDIQLMSMRTIEESEGKDGEEQKDGETEDKETGKENLEGKSDKVEIKEVSKEDDVTVGTFGFAEKVDESTTSKAENFPVVTESEKTADESKKDETAKEEKPSKDEGAKEEKNTKLVEVTIEKAGEESATITGSGDTSTPDKESATENVVDVSGEKEKAQEETKLQPVPVQIPVIGIQVSDEKAPDTEHAAETKNSEQSDKPASPLKDQSKDSGTSPSTKEVSKEPEPAATITKPQTEEVKTVLASDKPTTATEGLSLFTNEDMEKALGVAATKDLDQDESTQL